MSVFIISSDLWMCYYSFLFVCLFFSKNPYIPQLLPYFLGTIPQSYLRGCLLGYSRQWVHCVKHSLQLLVCMFFFL